jgi:hypothetical protein
MSAATTSRPNPAHAPAIAAAPGSDHEAHVDHEVPYAQQVRANRLGLWLF